jgi:hypothetical protein
MNAIATAVNNAMTIAEFDKIQLLASDFNGHYKKCALNYLEMGRIAFEAKSMGKVVYAIFCERVLMKGDSEMSKLIAIGQHYDLMKHRIECLPSKWTTLYNLTRLPKEEFETLCDSGRIHQGLTGAQSLELLGKTPEKSAVKSKSDTASSNNSTSDFTGFGVYIYCESPEKAKEIKTIIQLAIEDGLNVRLSSEYESYEEAVNDASALEVA